MTGTATQGNGGATDTVVGPLPPPPPLPRKESLRPYKNPLLRLASCALASSPSLLVATAHADSRFWGIVIPSPSLSSAEFPPLSWQEFNVKKSVRTSTRAGATIEQVKRSAVPDFAPSDIFVAKLEPKEVLRNLSPAGTPRARAPLPHSSGPLCRKGTHTVEPWCQKVQRE